MYDYVDPSAGDYHDQMADAGYANPYLYDELANVSGTDAAIFGAIGRAIGGAAKGIVKGVSAVGKVVQSGVKVVTNNPLWDIARTGVSFIPGVGTAVSAGMAGAAAIGRGDSIKDIGLAAAKGAIPGGPAAQAAFDVALGLAKGKNVTSAILDSARNIVPGGDLGKAAFDAATAIGQGKAFDEVALNAIRSRVPGGAAGQAAFNTAIQQFKEKKGASSTSAPPFPALNMTVNRVARAMSATPALQRAPVSNVARELGVSIEAVQKAVAAMASKWSQAQGKVQWTDVGSADSLESCCERDAIPMGAGAWDDVGMLQQTGEFPGDAGAPNFLAPFTMTKRYGSALYRHGHQGVKKGMLAHGILARLHHNTGELDGAGYWTVRAGDTPSGMAQKVTGSANRWQEILPVNPTLKVVTVGSTTQVQPFNPGQKVRLPASWLGTASPAPQSTTPSMPIPVSGAQATIRQGDTGITVKTWQQLLIELGSQLVGQADGIFGPQTAAATKGYQQARGLQADGVVGPLTWSKAIAEATAKKGGPPPIVISPPPIAVPPPALPPVNLPPSLPPVVVVSPPGGAPPIAIPIPPAVPPGAPPVAQPPPVVIGPAVPTRAPQVAIGAVEVALAYFYQKHPDAVFLAGSPAYGVDPADHSGTWDPRDKTAMLGFQKWANDNAGVVGFPLPLSGEPDELSVKALQAITAADLSKDSGQKIPPPAPPPAKPPPGKPPIITAGIGGKGDDLLVLGAIVGAAILAAGSGSGRRGRAA